MTKNGASWHLTRKSNISNKKCCDYTLYFFLENVEGLQTQEEASKPQKRTSTTTKHWIFLIFWGGGEALHSFCVTLSVHYNQLCCMLQELSLLQQSGNQSSKHFVPEPWFLCELITLYCILNSIKPVTSSSLYQYRLFFLSHCFHISRILWFEDGGGFYLWAWLCRNLPSSCLVEYMYSFRCGRQKILQTPRNYYKEILWFKIREVLWNRVQLIASSWGVRTINPLTLQKEALPNSKHVKIVSFVRIITFILILCMIL